jgi:hypothetical protein
MDTRLDLAIRAIEEKEYTTARNLLRNLLSKDDKNEQAWYWISRAVHTDRERRIYLKQALRINPKFTAAKEELESIEHQSVKPNHLPSEVHSTSNGKTDEFVSGEQRTTQKMNDRGNKKIQTKERKELVDEAKFARSEAILAFVGVLVFLGILIIAWEDLAYYVFAVKLIGVPLFGARLGFFLLAIYAAYRGHKRYSDYNRLKQHIELEKPEPYTKRLERLKLQLLSFNKELLKDNTEEDELVNDYEANINRDKFVIWIVVISLSWVIGWKLFFWILVTIPYDWVFVLSFGVFGLVVGLGQAFLLKNDIPIKKWLLASTIGGLLAGLVAIYLPLIRSLVNYVASSSNEPILVSFVLIGIIGAAIIAIVQLIFFRDLINNRYLWIISFSLGWGLGSLLSWNDNYYSERSFFDNIMRELIGGIVFSIASGLVMVYKLGLWGDQLGPRYRFDRWRSRNQFDIPDSDQVPQQVSRSRSEISGLLSISLSSLEMAIKLVGGLLNFLLGLYVIGAIISFFIIQHDCSGGFEPSYFKIIFQALLWPFTILGFGRSGYWSMECY